MRRSALRALKYDRMNIGDKSIARRTWLEHGVMEDGKQDTPDVDWQV